MRQSLAPLPSPLPGVPGRGSETRVSVLRSPAIGSRMDDTTVNVAGDDWELLATYARQRSQEAFGRLAGKYSPMVFATALRRTRRADVAEDVTQAVFIVL